MKRIVGFLTLILISVTISAQNRNSNYENYIRKYADIAVEQQSKYQIPASITLAQGLLESAAGQSELSQASNNHFGIKCHNNWEGEKVYQRDDNVTSDCFRKYNTVEESYEDHSLFLRKRSYYYSLFELSPTDYKSWARGLKKAGYASDPQYAEKLIKLIEDYDLHKYDLSGNKERIFADMQIDNSNHVKRKNSQSFGNSTSLKGHEQFRNNGVKCVFSLPGDTYAGIAEEFGLSESKILQYNDINKSNDLQQGAVVYVKAKKNKASKEFLIHEVKAGENMYRISQKYAIKLNKLYEMNNLPYSKGASVGMKLKLR